MCGSTFDRAARRATVTVLGPDALPGDLAGIHDAGAAFWPLAMARELDDAILHLRFNEPELGLIVFRSRGRPGGGPRRRCAAGGHADDWLVREIRLLLKRVFKRVDMTARSLFALIEPGSCFAGTLAELVFAADRALMFAGARGRRQSRPRHAASVAAEFRRLPDGQRPDAAGDAVSRRAGQPRRARASASARRSTPRRPRRSAGHRAYDEVDWDDEVRLVLEERACFSPDALTGLEANLRFAGPETMETRIFGRLTAWQNWIFQRPNAVGEAGALKRYGTGLRPELRSGAGRDTEDTHHARRIDRSTTTA